MKTQFIAIEEYLEGLATAMERLLFSLINLGANQPGEDVYFDGKVDRHEANQFVIWFGLHEMYRLNGEAPLSRYIVNLALPTEAVELYRAAEALEKAGLLDPDEVPNAR